jgi:TRAP-type uncharacterized transport system fused permease subunit
MTTPATIRRRSILAAGTGGLALAPVPAAELPKPREVLTLPRLAPLFVPIGILLVLLFSGASLTAAGFWACVSVMALYLLADRSRAGVRMRALALVDALAKGGTGWRRWRRCWSRCRCSPRCSG